MPVDEGSCQLSVDKLVREGFSNLLKHHRCYIHPAYNTQTGKTQVTICIATICNDSKTVIVASDRMVTAGDLSVAFEHETSKITPLADNCVGLTAGSALVRTDLFRAVRNGIHVGAAPPISEMADRVKEEYLRIRKRQNRREIF